VKPLISRPILQAATPNAASLIARAPSTGVSQSSILAHKGEGRGGPETDPFKPPREKGRRAVFCDPITLPSPTSPNTPPIIHQPPAGPPTDPTSAAAGTVGRLITPTWSAPPLPTAATAQVCRLSPEKGGGGGVGVTTVVEADKPPTEMSEKGPSSSFSKLLSNVKRTPSLSDRHHHHPQEKKDDKPSTLPRKPKGGGGAARPERQSLRNLEISGPVLQSSVDHHARLHLIPVVCRSPELSSGEQTQSEENPAANSRQGSPSLKRPAPPPPSAKPSSAVVLPERKASIPNDDLSVSNTTKSKFSLPWRSVKPNRTETSSESVPKSSSDDILEQKKGNEQQSQPASSSSTTRSGHHR